MADFPRFGDRPWRRLPVVPAELSLRIDGAVADSTDIPLRDVLALPRRTIIADFHCVTTWSIRALRWSGVPFRAVFDDIIVPRCSPAADVRWLRVAGLDGASAIVSLEDALAEDVMLADEMDGAPLSLLHGAPVRFVSPGQYAYKSVKHVSGIELCVEQPRSTSGAKEHPRGRVALEERHSHYPQWLVRTPYRIVAPVAALLAERVARAGANHRPTTSITRDMEAPR